MVIIINLIKTSTEELNSKKMILLIPFKLLNLRKKIEKSRDRATIQELKNILINDILKSIELNLKLGNIESADAYRIKECTVKLYQHLYANYEEMEREGINLMVDDMIELEVDKIIDKYERKIKQVTEQVTEQNIYLFVSTLREVDIDDTIIFNKLIEKYGLSEEDAKKYLIK